MILGYFNNDYLLSHNVSVYLLLPYIYTFLSSDLTLTITYKDSVCEYTKQLSKHTKNRASSLTFGGSVLYSKDFVKSHYVILVLVLALLALYRQMSRPLLLSHAYDVQYVMRQKLRYCQLNHLKTYLHDVLVLYLTF